jgi:putative hemolysin
MNVVNLLWRGIVQYAVARKARYLIGCSSLTSQCPETGWSMYRQMHREHLVCEPLRTSPLPAFTLPMAEERGLADRPPRLLRAYLAMGAKICGPPALDREFKTIDFLTLLDLEEMPPAAISHFRV